MALPALLTQITIDSTCDTVDVHIHPTSYACDVTETEYASIKELATALQNSIRTHTGNSSFTVTVSATTGKVTIACPGTNFELPWLTGASASVTMGEILGFDVSADDSTASTQTWTSDYQHQYGWYPEVAPTSDSYNRPKLIGPETFLSDGGRAQRITWGTQYVREVKFEFIAADKFLDAYATLNESFEEWWLEAAAGTPFEYYSDISAGTNDGTYVLLVGANEDLLQGTTRLSPGDAYYDRTLRMVSQE